MLETASRAARKPAKGGLSNLICIAEPLEVIATELAAFASQVTVILPWGSLLRSLVTPEPPGLDRLVRLCAPNATVEIVFSYDEKRDATAGAPLGNLAVRAEHVCGLATAYRAAGLEITVAERISQSALNLYHTTWSSRLAFGQPREVWRILARLCPRRY